MFVTDERWVTEPRRIAVKGLLQEYRDQSLNRARAIIEVLRIPTATVIQAGIDAMESEGAHDREVKVGAIWAAMISEALK